MTHVHGSPPVASAATARDEGQEASFHAGGSAWIGVLMSSTASNEPPWTPSRQLVARCSSSSSATAAHRRSGNSGVAGRAREAVAAAVGSAGDAKTSAAIHKAVSRSRVFGSTGDGRSAGSSAVDRSATAWRAQRRQPTGCEGSSGARSSKPKIRREEPGPGRARGELDFPPHSPRMPTTSSLRGGVPRSIRHLQERRGGCVFHARSIAAVFVPQLGRTQ